MLVFARYRLDGGGIGRRLIEYGGIRFNNNLDCNLVVGVDDWMQYAEPCWVQIPTYPIRSVRFRLDSRGHGATGLWFDST